MFLSCLAAVLHIIIFLGRFMLTCSYGDSFSLFVLYTLLNLLFVLFPCCLSSMQIDLMISGNQPVKAIDYICDLTLFWVVFNLPLQVEPAVSEGCYRFVVNLIMLYPICSSFSETQVYLDFISFKFKSQIKS